MGNLKTEKEGRCYDMDIYVYGYLCFNRHSQYQQHTTQSATKIN